MSNVNRRSFLKNSLVAGAGLATISTIGANANSVSGIKPGFKPASGKRTNNKFGFSVLCMLPEVGRNLFKGYDEIYIPISDIYTDRETCNYICPLDHNRNWPARRDEVLSWGFPVHNTSHFAESVLPVVGPDADFELATYFVRRAMARCNEIGVKVCGIFGGYFINSTGQKQSLTKITDQSLRFLNMCADEAAPYGIRVAIEPRGGENDLWPLYLDAVGACRRLGRDNVGCMVDTAYFMLRNQDFNDILKYPEYLFANEMQGVGGQPGYTGDERRDPDTRFFRALRDVGWEGVVDFAVTWRNTSNGPLDITAESKKSLEYVKRIQDQVYAE